MSELAVQSQPLGVRNGLMRIAGKLDSSTFEQMEDELNRVLESGVLGLAVEASGLEAVSMAGLGLFVDLRRTLGERGGRFMLVAPSGDVLEVIRILGVGEALDVVDSVDAAKRELSKTK